MGLLKDKLIEEIKLRGLSARTEQIYVQVAQKFILFTKKSTSELSLEDARTYKLNLISLKRAPRTINQEMSVVKFFSYLYCEFPGIITNLNH